VWLWVTLIGFGPCAVLRASRPVGYGSAASRREIAETEGPDDLCEAVQEGRSTHPRDQDDRAQPPRPGSPETEARVSAHQVDTLSRALLASALATAIDAWRSAFCRASLWRLLLRAASTTSSVFLA
jgi:hypothetical protein